MRVVDLVALLGCGLVVSLGCEAQTAIAKRNTIWDGIFSPAEVTRGEGEYRSDCSRCHGEDLSGQGGVLRGEKFMDRWREDSLASLFNNIRDTMPPGPRGRVQDAEYVDILAFLLSSNGFPTGKADLNPREFDRIRIVGKEGPMPVPDFSLVSVVGCLGKDDQNHWVLRKASEPVRTRIPRDPTESETAADLSRKGGEHEFHFLDTYEFASEFQAGRWMQAKGFLIRSPGNDRLNLTWLKVLRPSCEAPK